MLLYSDMKKLGFLVIGTNFISDKFCNAVKSACGVETVAVYSRKLHTGEAFAQRHGIKRVYCNLDEALLDKDIDAVYVASPTFLHKEHSIKAMRAGKHVLCEKSIALSFSELSEMKKVSLDEGRVLLEAMRPAFDPAIELVKRSLLDIGKIRRADLQFCQYSSRYDKFKEGIVENAFNPEIGNSALSDIGVYPLWLAVELFGKPVSTASKKTYLENGFLGMGISVLKYVDKLVTVTYSKITDGILPSVIEGEEGSIIINKISEPSEIYIKHRGKEKIKLDFLPSENNMIYEISEFKRMVEKKTDYLSYLRVTEQVMQIADEIHATE